MPFECLGDPLHAAYAEVSLGRGDRRRLLAWDVLRSYPRAIRTIGGLGRGGQGGDMALQPGTFVVAGDGTLAFAHYARNSADNPPVEAVLAAARSAR